MKWAARKAKFIQDHPAVTLDIQKISQGNAITIEPLQRSTNTTFTATPSAYNHEELPHVELVQPYVVIITVTGG